MSSQGITTTAVCLMLAAGPALAQSTPDIQRLEDQIQSMQQELNALKAAQAQAKPADSPKVVETPGHRFGLASADGANSIFLTGRLHLDAGDYFDGTPAGGPVSGHGPGSNAAGPLNGGINARRARIGITGTVMTDWAYTLIYDFGGSSDTLTTGQSGAPTSGLENAYVTYNGFYRPAYAVPVAIDLGYQDVPWTLDEATSSNDIMFMERASPQVVATAFGAGDFRSALGARSNNDRYWAGAYLTGPTSGSVHTANHFGDYAVLGRASYQLVDSGAASLHVGVDVAHLFHRNGNSLVLADRPELRIDPTNLLNTGTIPGQRGSVAGAELAASFGNLYAQGEYYHIMVDQNARGINPVDGRVNAVSPTLNFDGGYVQASYSVGGRRKYNPATGAYGGVIPDHPFSVTGGGWGAVEFAARFSAVNLNDHLRTGMTPSLTGGVAGGDQKGYSLGINWYPNTNVRFMLDYLREDVNNLLTGAAQNPAGGHVQAVAVRTQFSF